MNKEQRDAFSQQWERITSEKELREKAEALAQALIAMYRQYCPNGHQFMSAGEEASEVLEQYGYGEFDGWGEVIKWRDDERN